MKPQMNYWNLSHSRSWSKASRIYSDSFILDSRSRNSHVAIMSRSNISHCPPTVQSALAITFRLRYGTVRSRRDTFEYKAYFSLAVNLPVGWVRLWVTNCRTGLTQYKVLSLLVLWRHVVCARWVEWSILHRYHRYPLERRLGAFQSWSSRFREEKKLLPLPGFEHRSSSP